MIRELSSRTALESAAVSPEKREEEVGWALQQGPPGRKLFRLHLSAALVAISSSILTWRTPWTEEPGRLQSMGLQRVGHDWVTSLVTSTGETGTRMLLLLLSWIRTSGTQRLKPKQQIFQKTCCQQSAFFLISSLFENPPSCRRPLSLHHDAYSLTLFLPQLLLQLLHWLQGHQFADPRSWDSSPP